MLFKRMMQAMPVIKWGPLAFMLLLLLPFTVFSQTSVSGTVVDEFGKPVSGASVVIKEKTTGTSTNAEGKFTVNAKTGDVLTISSVGFEIKDHHVAGNENITITLKALTGSLEDVVVVGYGTRSKRNVGGAVVSVDNRVMKDRPVSNAIAALQGAAPGLVITRTNGQPGNEGWSARIRGITSLGAQNAPLVIVDGVEGDLNAINPNDIANISILEDAASASIYGAKAGGGVILITTKGGNYNQKPKFEIQSLYTYRKPYARPEMLSSRREAELQNIAQLNRPNGVVAFTDLQLARFDNPDSAVIWNPQASGGAGAWEFYYNNRMIDILMRKQSPQRNINLSLSGGGDKSTYLFSLGYLDQQGVFNFGPDSYNKFNARLNYNTKLSKTFSFDSRLSFIKDNTLQSVLGYGGEGVLYNIYSIRAARNPIFIPGTTDKYIFLGTLSRAYPVLKDGGYNDRDRYNVNGVFTLNAKQILRGLDLKAAYSPGMVATDQTVFMKTVPTWIYGKDGVLTPGTAYNTPNSVNKARPLTFTQSFFTTADYNLKLNKNSFHLLGGYEFKTYRFDQVNAIQRAILLNDFPSLNYSTLANAPTSNVSNNVQTNAWISYFGRLSYNFNEKYYFEGTARRDGSSRLSPGNKFQTFASGLVFWRLAQEEWFKNALPWFNEFKLSAAYGSLGGAQTADPNANNYDYQAFLSQGIYPFNDARTAYLTQTALPSEGKAWEVIKSADFGLKMEMLNSRLGVDFNYFIKTNNNVFTGQNLPALLGVAPNDANLASVQVKGWGIMVNWRDNFKDGSYFVSANLSDDKNKVLRYQGTQSYGLGINSNLVGYSTNSIFGYLANGYFNSAQDTVGVPRRTADTGPGDIRLVDVNGDGRISLGSQTAGNHGDLVYLGNTNSRYVYGLNAGVNWKGFDLSFIINGVGKRQMLIAPYASMAFYDGWRMPWKIHEDYWTPENTDARFPRILVGDRINDQVSSHWVQNASYIRLKNVQIGYTLNKTVHKIKFVNDIKLYVNGQDLWEKTGMWFNYADPENLDNANFSYPLWRSYSVGLNIGF